MLTLLAHLARELQHNEAAKARYREALTLYRTFSSPSYTAGCLEGFAAAICAEGHYVQATRFCAAAASLREQAQVPLLPTEREAFEQVIAQAKAALDENTFASEWATGAALTHDEAIDAALSSI
jgi:Tfp pilus assembly protein PilF